MTLTNSKKDSVKLQDFYKMPNNISNFIKSASPIEIFVVARRLADCNDGMCPAKCTDSKYKCFETYPHKCAMNFKKWALHKEK